MKIKTSELTGNALRYAVACAEGMSFPHLKHCKWPDDHEWVLHPDGSIRHAVEFPSSSMNRQYDYTTWAPDDNWDQGGPIIEREGICLLDPCSNQNRNGEWHANCGAWGADGATALIAAMRCYVASKFGDEVDVPEELL